MSKTKIISLPANAYGIRRWQAGYNQRVYLFWILIMFSVFSLFTYIYNINVLARNIATKQDLETQIANMSADFDSLEFAYIGLRNNITIELAYQHGFQEIRSPLYISRTRPQSLSFNISNY